MSAISIETISNAVCESSRRSNTAREMRSGFSSTSECVAEEPIAETMPSPTRAMIVSSVATADQLQQIGPHGHPSLNLELNAVLGDRVERFFGRAAGGAVDHLGVNAGLHGFEYIATRQVDRRGQLEVELHHLRLMGGDDRPHELRHAAPGEVVRFERPWR